VNAGVIQTENLGSLFISGSRGFKFIAALRSFVGFSYVAAAGRVPRFSVSVAALGENRIASGCFGRRGHSHHGRVQRRGIGLSRTAARHGGEGCEGLAPHPFAPLGYSGIALVSRGVVCIVAFGSQRSAAIAPLCG